MLGDTSAAAAIDSTEVAAYPLRWKSRSASRWMVARVRAFLRSRSPGEVVTL